MQQLGQESPESTTRLIWAFIIIGLIIGLWGILQPPPKAPPPPPEPPPPVAAAPSGPEPAAAPAIEPAVVEAPVAAESERDVLLENQHLRLVISNRGALLKSAVLKGFREPGSQKPDDLVSPAAALQGRFPLALASEDAAFNQRINGSLFHVEQSGGKGGQRTLFHYSDGAGTSVRKALTLPAEGYTLDVEVSLAREGKAVEPVPLTWGAGFAPIPAQQARNTYYQQEYAAFSRAGGFEKVAKSKKPSSGRYGDQGPISWAAVSDNYFAAVFVPETPSPWIRVQALPLSEAQQKVHPSETALSLEVALPGRSKLHLIPKEWARLSSMKGTFYRLADWGWLGPICAALLWSMKKLFLLVRNYGLAVILLTFVIKLLFFPLTQRSMVKMKEMGDSMKRLKPQVDRIKAKYDKMKRSMETRSKMNEEVMALYQREGVNPLGGVSGCLPLLLQLPIFFALFTMLPRSIELRGAPFFGWIQDLSVYDPWYVTPILMGVSMIFSTAMTSTQLEGPQKVIMWFMPVMFTWFCLWAPAGLTLYWLTNNLLTMAQQALINRQVAKRQEEAAKGRKSTPKKQSRKS